MGQPALRGGGAFAWVEPRPRLLFLLPSPASLLAMPYREGSWRAPELAVDVEAIDPQTRLLAVRGELDVSTTPRLDEAFGEQFDDGGIRLVLDLTGITFIDSTAMALIAEWRDRLIDGGGALAVVAVAPQQRRLFHLTQLTERLRVSHSREEAVSALEKRGTGDERAGRQP